MSVSREMVTANRPAFKLSHGRLYRQGAPLLLTAFVVASGFSMMHLQAAWSAEKYESRLNSLLLQKIQMYLPSRLVIGEEASFVVKGKPGSQVKLYMSTTGEGFSQPDSGTALRVGKDASEVAGTIPENGVLQLKMDMPKEPGLEGQYLYVDALVGTEATGFRQVDLVDATGRRTSENALAIVKPSERGGPNIAPNLPGISPQMFNQLTQMGDMAPDDPRRKLLDNGAINRDRDIDRNPFVQRGAQPGLGGASSY